MGNAESAAAAAAAASSAPSRRQSRSGWSAGEAASAAAADEPKAAHTIAPGAYSVPGNPSMRQNQQFYVTVPDSIKPGEEFPVLAGGYQLMVKCPVGTNGGDRIVVQSPNKRSCEAFMAIVPAGISPGLQFPVLVREKQMMVTCPPGVGPGMKIRIMVPLQLRDESSTTLPPSPFGDNMYEVVIPSGVRPGQPFALLAGEQRVLVTCPARTSPGQKIQFRLPIQMSQADIETIKLNYDKEGWTRCMTQDLNFVWVRHDGVQKEDGSDPSKDRLTKDNVDRLAFVRKLTFTKKKTVTDADIELIPAAEAVASSLVGEKSLAKDLAKQVGSPFRTKEAWFRGQISALQIPWEEGHIRINVRREHLLVDAFEGMGSVKESDMRKTFRFEFQGEPGVDAGGVAREFFQLVSEQLCHPDNGLFTYSAINQMNMQINPMSGFINPRHLEYFHFCGRLMAKALFDRQIVNAHLVANLYKQILAWPITIHDLEALDADVHQNMIKLLDLDDISILDLDFTISIDQLGEHKEVELKPGGVDVTVTNENIEEFLTLQMKYRILDRMKDQVKHFLIGFYEVIPATLLSVFDFQELELLLCGLPEIDVVDWMTHSEYTGAYEIQGANHPNVVYFWEVVEEEFNMEQRARLLQYVTGTSGVPASGFAHLQGNDGNIRKFTVNSITKTQSIFPRAHTCFNRIDLPLYEDKKELQKYLTLAVQMECTGFSTD